MAKPTKNYTAAEMQAIKEKALRKARAAKRIKQRALKNGSLVERARAVHLKRKMRAYPVDEQHVDLLKALALGDVTTTQAGKVLGTTSVASWGFHLAKNLVRIGRLK